MTEDLQKLLEKIQDDGVNKAQAEAEAILSKAAKEAEALIASAQQESDKIKADAKTEADAYAARAEETIRQSARDTLLHVEQSVTALLEKLLKKSVDATLNSEQTIAPLVIDAVKSYLGEGEHLKIVASEKMLETLRAELASMAQDGIEIVTDKTVGTGFRVKLADGRIEHDFTGTAVVDALAKQLRPALAALLNS